MQKEIAPGFFTMETITAIVKESDLEKAKQIAIDAVDAQPNAKFENKVKALAVIRKASSTTALGISLTNFLLAHPSEGLAMK